MQAIHLARTRWQLECASALMLFTAVAARVRQRDLSHAGGSARHGHRPDEPDASESSLRIGATFFRQLWQLLKICIPSPFSTELAQLGLMTLLFWLRARLTLRIAENVGRSGRYIVSREGVKFRDSVVALGLLSIPGAILHAGLLYLKIMLRLNLRQRLNAALQQEYLEGQKLYHIANANSCDFNNMQLSVEVREFTTHLVNLFTSALKPMIDTIVLTHTLYQRGGVAPIAFIASYYALVSTIMSTCFPNFSKLVLVAQNRENSLRALHAELVRHAEEVSFYGGEDLELDHANRSIHAITRHETRIKNIKWWSSLCELILAKYGSLCCGYIVCGCMAMRQQDSHTSQADRVEYFVRDTQLYLPFSQALSRLVLLRQKAAALVTRTSRISAMRDFIANVDVTSARIGDVEEAAKVGELECECSVSETFDLTMSKSSVNGTQVSGDGAPAEAPGVCKGGDGCSIVLSHVDVYTPDDRLVIADFSLTVRQGWHTLISGINGSGKTALVRVLTRLWPLRRGTICAPSREDMFVVPQRVYLFPGTLRSQMIYPAIDAKPGESSFSDEEITAVANRVGIESVLVREGGLDAQKNWQNTLSGGERQRIALVRVILHRPRFAILDECTSAISQDDELKLYMHLQRIGITLVTISHRVELRKIHQVLVELDGLGGYHTRCMQ